MLVGKVLLWNILVVSADNAHLKLPRRRLQLQLLPLFRRSVSFILSVATIDYPSSQQAGGERLLLLWLAVHCLREGREAGQQAWEADPLHTEVEREQEVGPDGETGSSQRMANASKET